MRGLRFICNTPSAYAVISVLHRPTESATESRHGNLCGLAPWNTSLLLSRLATGDAWSCTNGRAASDL